MAAAVYGDFHYCGGTKVSRVDGPKRADPFGSTSPKTKSTVGSICDSKIVMPEPESQKQIIKRLETAIELTIKNAEQEKDEYENIIVKNFGLKLFEQLAEAYPYVKMDYEYDGNDGKILIIEVQGQGHQHVISRVSGQFCIWQATDQLLKNKFRIGGGLTNAYELDADGFAFPIKRRVDPDNAIQVDLGELVNRFVFEIEIQNRNISKLDLRRSYC